MNWFNSLSFKQKLLFGCYGIVGLFALTTIVLLTTHATLIPGLITLVILVGISYPIINMLERSLNEPIKDMSNSALQIARGDFSQTVQVTSDDALGELGHSFNSMLLKLREILQQTTDITRHVSDSDGICTIRTRI